MSRVLRDGDHKPVAGEHDRLPDQALAKSSSGSFVFAAAKTSGFTPCRICAASSSEPAKQKRTRVVEVLAVGPECLSVKPRPTL